MTLENWAGIGLALAAAAVVMVLRRSRTADGVGLSVQIGDRVLSGHYRVRDGRVDVTCDRGAKSTPLNGRDPLRVAETLLVMIDAEAKRPD